MKRWIVPVLAAAVVAVMVPVVALAASSGTTSSQVNRQLGVWRNSPISTTSTSFQALSGLGAKICSTGEVSVTVSLDGTGAPMGLRVLVNYGATMEPGAIRFAPQGAADTTSFTFVQNTQPFEANDNHYFDLEWRSPFGGKTTLLEATMNLVYQQGTHAC
jgi:hypothetical protein